MYQATIEDPTVLPSPWTVEILLHPSEGPIFEVACHEGNLGLANICRDIAPMSAPPLGAERLGETPWH